MASQVQSCSEKIELSKIKLIIWDLDETFWTGTISEGKVTIPQKNIDLIKCLTARGIVNSICSKNDLDTCQKRLSESGIWEYFVFPSIDWEAKGFRIKSILSNMSLRAANVLFIDDNAHNLGEAKEVNPGLMVANPEIINVLRKNVNCLGKDDSELSRLKQYQILQTKYRSKEAFGDNVAFLRSSKIIVTIDTPDMSDVDRIYELVMRTNQLNYTKKRVEKECIENYIKKARYNCGLVRARDRFGDYGVIGFYVLTKGELEHFLFSCRTLGMGIEQYVYSVLGYPKLTTVGDVATVLNDSEFPDWINLPDDDSSKTIETDSIEKLDGRVLIKGPCDMLSVFTYISDETLIDTEFTYINSRTGVSVEDYNHSWHIINSFSLSDERKREIINEVPFGDDGLFSTGMFNHCYKVVFLSLLLDATLGVYVRKQTGERICFGYWKDDITDERLWESIVQKRVYTSNCGFTYEELERFRDQYVYAGRISVEDTIANIVDIRNRLSPECKLVLISGSEIPYERETNRSFIGISDYYKKLNALLRERICSLENVSLIELSKYVHSQSSYYNSGNHFSKEVYFELSKDIVKEINALSNANLSKPSVVRLFVEKSKRFLLQLIPSERLKTKLYYLIKIKKSS